MLEFFFWEIFEHFKNNFYQYKKNVLIFIVFIDNRINWFKNKTISEIIYILIPTELN